MVFVFLNPWTYIQYCTPLLFVLRSSSSPTTPTTSSSRTSWHKVFLKKKKRNIFAEKQIILWKQTSKTFTRRIVLCSLRLSDCSKPFPLNITPIDHQIEMEHGTQSQPVPTILVHYTFHVLPTNFLTGWFKKKTGGFRRGRWEKKTPSSSFAFFDFHIFFFLLLSVFQFLSLFSLFRPFY